MKGTSIIFSGFLVGWCSLYLVNWGINQRIHYILAHQPPKQCPRIVEVHHDKEPCDQHIYDAVYLEAGKVAFKNVIGAYHKNAIDNKNTSYREIEREAALERYETLTILKRLCKGQHSTYN